ncbi:MAG: HigA family addiction module antitoxin [Alphaproteobacteria bacterium]|nr:HigA family addiction module antitoxin [Alphaproteobacteria bacterium]
MNYRQPAEAFPPGEFLRDELEARGWNQAEFADIIGRPARLVSEILAGKRGITPETAIAIAAALGTSPEFWMNLDASYQLFRSQPAPERIAKEAALREKFPVREMIKRGWIQASQNYDVLESSVFAFFGINSIDESPELVHAARRNYSETLSPLQIAWLFRVKQLASAVQMAKYNEQKLRNALTSLEALMTAPEEIRHVPKILAECGVRLVIVEPIPGSKINGACFWLNKGAPVIGLTVRGDCIDRFWFDLRHEIEHVLRQDGQASAIIDDDDLVVSEGSNVSEAENAANKAARDFCVPDKDMTSFIIRLDPIYSEENLIGFSRLIKRHPGIVAGQLQHRTNKWSLFRKHQVKVRQVITQSALTDGYGVITSLAIDGGRNGHL